MDQIHKNGLSFARVVDAYEKLNPAEKALDAAKLVDILTENLHAAEAELLKNRLENL